MSFSRACRPLKQRGNHLDEDIGMFHGDVAQPSHNILGFFCGVGAGASSSLCNGCKISRISGVI